MKPYFYFALTGLMIYLSVLIFVELGWLLHAPSYTIIILLSLLFVTAVIYNYIARFAAMGPEAITRFYLLSIALKLMVGCSMILVVVIFDRDGASGNTVLFLISYIIFTSVEIVFLFGLRKE